MGMGININKTVLVVLAEGFEDIEAVTPIDVLNRAGANVTISGMETRPVRGAYGSTIIGHTTIDKVEGVFDALIFPGGEQCANTLANNTRVVELVRRHHETGKLIAAIGASVGYLLAESAGIMKGRRATGDQNFSDKSAAGGVLATSEPVVKDSNIITGTGPGSAMLFSLTIIEYLFNREIADSFAREWHVIRHQTAPVRQLADVSL
jgi:4-methyl-5(b-hydroxyethyl)-thiazole monophosphate biosynthesis